MKPLTLGTAGHIDHGKTALIRALTGVNTDRLPQEQARGISIELGYASLTLPSGRRLSVVDVPGHERFVRTMVAGATGIDLFLMTIAADDGVMPQTREHAAVLEALGVKTGVVAVTKSDLADPDLALLEASELFPAAETVAVSARTGAGLDELRAALERACETLASRADTGGPARLHIDRVFTIRGAGTVVTGTLWSGEVGRGDELEVLPQGRHVRVRGVQVHDQSVDRAPAGQRVAVNLIGTAVDELERGDVLVSGDVVQNKLVPNLIGENVTAKSWIAILDKLELLKPRFIVPDHGTLGDASLIAQERGFLVDLRGRALELKRQGKTADEAAPMVAAEFKAKFPDWTGNAVAADVRKIYAEPQ